MFASFPYNYIFAKIITMIYHQHSLLSINLETLYVYHLLPLTLLRWLCYKVSQTVLWKRKVKYEEWVV